ncbi:serine/threonine-protein kinase [Corallococcus carmarthensis]|uniref:Serine/threonine protein kinase n=1 Tax=Corallococcus carmarthensis TaxID=2316728 RepID=A0A3A8K5E0_9BACT|nr:serine/threonine-protein kinase [Corallococcus carmarthensis]NOK21776.1 protein kinase [Corallococcus carmarthensis]RKH02399.1 serine/threonine protein kinase [Corallococcus carmarthensis]
MELQAGDTFGRYELVSWLGRGGMAETWRAQLMGAAGVTKSVLIKKVLPEYADDEAFISMFISEARISATLSHGNVAQVFDFGQVADEYFLAMEFVDGRPLDKVLKRALKAGLGALPIPAAIFIAMEMCRGLHYAHTRTDGSGKSLGIVHRDISPDNVLVSYEGQVKIVDFGIAKAQLLRGFKTEPGVVKGKYLFFSPEQARGEEVDARTDVWATGIVLYSLLCAKLPVEGPPQTVMMKIAHGQIPAPTTLRPGLPKELNDLVMKALAPDQEQRFESSHAFGDALAEFLHAHYPRFSSLSLANLLRLLFRADLTNEGRELSVPEAFLDEAKKWGEPALAKLLGAPPPQQVQTRRMVRAVAKPPPTDETTQSDAPTIPTGRSRKVIYGAGAAGGLAVAGACLWLFVGSRSPEPVAQPAPVPQAVAVEAPAPKVEAEPPPAPSPVKEPEAVAEVPAESPAEPEATRPAHSTRKISARPVRATQRVQSANPEPVVEEPAPPTVVVASAVQQPPPVVEESAPAPKKGVFGMLDSKRQEVAQKVSSLVKTKQQEVQQKVSGLLQSKDYDAALEVANDCAKNNPRVPECHLMLGDVHAKLNHPRESTQHYEMFLALAPEDHPRRARVIEMLAKAGAAN